MAEIKLLNIKQILPLGDSFDYKCDFKIKNKSQESECSVIISIPGMKGVSWGNVYKELNYEKFCYFVARERIKECLLKNKLKPILRYKIVNETPDNFHAKDIPLGYAEI
jgi:hypothetical protein